MTERESMAVDVVVAGAGPAGLAAAIRLKQLARDAGSDLSVMVLEKGAEVGAHILSGAVIDPSALSDLIPDWQGKGAPVTTRVTSDRFAFLTRKGIFSIPRLFLPPMLSNEGNYIVSLGQLTRWLAEQAEALGVDIFPGFAASELLFDENGAVAGVATGDMGRARDGSKKPEFAPGMELHARYTLLAEGARGSLSKSAIRHFDLDRDSDPQKFGLGIKEIWQVDPARHRPGHVEHTFGWPLPNDTGGGGFIYHAADGRVLVGFVTHLDYSNPYLSPFDEMQRFKTHPHVAALLEGGERIAWGARAMTSGGWQSIPRLEFPGGALVGCAAGFMNVPRIKGAHNAMRSGMKCAQMVFDALAEGRGNDLLQGLSDFVVAGDIERDLKPVRNAKPMWERFGTFWGTALAGAELWMQTLFARSPLGTLGHGKPDSQCLKKAAEAAPIPSLKPDGVLTFDKPSSVFLANISHGEDQPVHLRLRDPDIPLTRNLPDYDEPATRYCPAGVYEITRDAQGTPQFVINAANCVHCKTCDIKDPAQNIDWCPPEGGSGPNYQGM